VNRTQHVVSSGIIAAVGITVCWISFTQSPSEAFLFPRLISSIFVALALWTFGKALLGWSKTGTGISSGLFLRMFPGMVVALIYALWAAKELGFYTATTIAFFTLLSLYDPAPHSEPKSLVRRIIITACYMAVMYGLFAMLLKVYTPREIFF